MATVPEIHQREAPLRLPLLLLLDPAAVLVWRDGGAVTASQFLAHVRQVAETLPTATAAVNLCEDRYAFLVAFAAIVLRGQANLLPSSRARHAIDEVMRAHPGCYAMGEQNLQPAPPGYRQLPPLATVQIDAGNDAGENPWPMIPAEQVVAIGYTSGSTGKPSANVKTWRSFHASNAGNLAMLHEVVGPRFEVVATIPPQHMYGMEMSVLLPLLGGIGVHANRPFFPADVASALAQVPEPRVLVATPVHLRALVEADIRLPPIAAMLSATAPLPVELARAAERCFEAPVLEVFGSTETCVIAARQPARDEAWRLYDGVDLYPQPDGTVVHAPQLDAPITLPDIVSLSDGGRRFRLRGRHADMLEIAGKRASLGDLTRRLLDIPGVSDAVVFQLGGEGDSLGVHRIAALVVAPELDEHWITEQLRLAIDPLFLPRPLRLVQALPRNETGKLPRKALLELLHQHH